MPDGFLLDLDRCTGCAACGIACTIENELPADGSWRQVRTFNEARHPELPSHNLSMACHHCADAPCMKACPALAISRNGTTSAVLIDPSRCIGCGYCAWACPYDAPRYDARAGVMTKCTLCHPRLLEHDLPACVVACPTDALRFGDLESSGGAEQVAGFPRSDARPSIRFLGPRGGSVPPEGIAASRTTTGGPEIGAGLGTTPESEKIGLRTEWPLVLFTMIAAWLVALVLASLIAPLAIAPAPYLGVAIAALALSSAHLGRPLRAWRAVLNLRHSWLSREVFFFSAFLGAAAASLLVAPRSRALLWAAGLLGMAALYSIDRVYDVMTRPGPRLHSAEVSLTGLFLASLLAGSAIPALLFGLLKGGLYLMRRRRMAFSPGWWLSAARLGAGLVVPAVLWWMEGPHLAVLIAAGAGELLDRCEYDTDLQVSTPHRQIRIDLEAALAGR